MEDMIVELRPKVFNFEFHIQWKPTEDTYISSEAEEKNSFKGFDTFGQRRKTGPVLQVVGKGTQQAIQSL